MAASNGFVDEIEVRVRGGHGGDGCVHFLSEKYRPHGGPDGGDGGRGGDVFFEAHTSISSLGHLKKSKVYSASNGIPGKQARCTGASGDSLTVFVPVGTEVFVEGGRLLEDLSRPGKRFLVVQGGKGGAGNQHFASSVNQAPEYARPGLPGEERTVLLSLKLLADTGLIGLPNAGKSTLLGCLSANHPKVAAYAFTTLSPNLGMVESERHRRLLLADIPGIVAGASRGVGLGLSFLRHIERVRVMAYVLDICSLDMRDDLLILREELEVYSPELLRRPAILVINKLDEALYDERYARILGERLLDPELWGEGTLPKIVYVSALEKWGMDGLVSVLFELFPDETFAEQLLSRRAVSRRTAVQADD